MTILSNETVLVLSETDVGVGRRPSVFAAIAAMGDPTKSGELLVQAERWRSQRRGLLDATNVLGVEQVRGLMPSVRLLGDH